MEKLKVLVVDDDREIVDSIAIFLRADGYEIEKAYNGLEALDIVMTHTIHLIILDIMMPELDGIKTLLLKPQTFMNLSGNSVGKVAAFYKIPPENIIVIHDDKDLALGKLKAKIGGSAGGHNGLKNIDSQIGQNYNRIRIGVGSPQEHHTDTVNFVLSRFSKAEMTLLQERIDFIASTINELIKKGVTHYSNIIGMHNSK